MLPQAGTIPLAIISLFLTERRRVLLLPDRLANMFGLLALVATAVEFMGENLEARLLAGAHLLVYLTWITIFQDKKPRQYWWLCALGVMQVAVASILTKQGTFGVLLMFYVIGSIWTLSVFSLHRAQQRYDNARRYAVQTMESIEGQSTTDQSPTSTALEPQQSLAIGAVQQDLNGRWINFRFAGGVVSMSVIAICIGMVFFALIPRIWIGRFSLFAADRDRAIGPMTGFTEEVELGEMGEILESNERVLQVRCYDNRTGIEIDIVKYAQQRGFEEPIFRGKTMGIYENGRWNSVDPEPDDFLPDHSVLREPKKQIRQVYTLEPIGTSLIFAMHPVSTIRLQSRETHADFHTVTSTLWRSETSPANETLKYDVYSDLPTDAPTDGEGRKLARIPFATIRNDSRFNRKYLEIPDGLERIREIAADTVGMDQVTRDLNDQERANLLSDNPRLAWQVAQHLAAYLRDSGDFDYTLDAKVVDKTVDPIVDFLVNRRAGHCEYFASALALMLRAAGIPSRLVSGFKGGTINQYTKAYVVQQRHAHAWVEAYISNRWILLDPTPAAREESVQSMAAQSSSWRDVRDMISGMWSQNVVDMSLEQQRAVFYAPLQEAFKKLADSISSQGSNIFVRVGRDITSPEAWTSWRGPAMALFLLVALICSVWTILHITAAIKKLSKSRKQQVRAVAIRVEFFEKFLALLARHGFVRDACQTPREFCSDVQQSLNTQLAAAELKSFPSELVEQFYSVRFGQRQLATAELKVLEDQLRTLESALAFQPEQRS